MIDAILHSLSVGWGYLSALGLIVAGIYLGFVLPTTPMAAPFARLLRFLGVALVAMGAGLGAYTIGRSNGAADCQAAWKARNLEAQIGRLKQEAAVKQIAADLAGRQASELADQNADLQTRVNDYANSLRNADTCRRATRDDDRRVCDITGRSAPGCANP
jgi:hypothetical protein